MLGLACGLLMTTGAALAAGPAAGTAQVMPGLAVAGIVEGGAVLVRQSTRFVLLEGVRLAGDDIVEAAPGGHVQIEFADGVVLSLADGARVMLQPRWAQRRGAPAAGPRAYVLDGWIKLAVPASASAASATLWLAMAPGLVLAPQAQTQDLPQPQTRGQPPAAQAAAAQVAAAADRPATAVLRLAAPDHAVFVESGRFRLGERHDTQRAASLGANDFVWRQGAAKAQQARRPSSEFVAALPPLFRDALPARAGRYADRAVAPKPQGEIAYNDVSAWLRGEPGLRAALVERWRGRAGDPVFRAALQANLAQHPEWDAVLAPPRLVDRAASPVAPVSR